jgi:hypothetical protein
VAPTADRSAGTVGEPLGWEQPGPLPRQEPVHRARRQGRLTPAGTSGGQLRAAQLAAKGHNDVLRVRRQGPGVCQLNRSPTNQPQDSGHLEAGVRPVSDPKQTGLRLDLERYLRYCNT